MARKPTNTNATAAPKPATADEVQDKAEGVAAPAETKAADEAVSDIPVETLHVRTVGKKPRRRSGIAFGPDARTIEPSDFPEGLHPAIGLLAIVEDPALVCFHLSEDGKEVALDPDRIANLREMVANLYGDDEAND